VWHSKEAEKQARIQKKEEKSKARKEAEAADREQAEREEALAREREQKRQRQQEEVRKAREEEKRALKEQRKRLRDLCLADDNSLLDASAMDLICGKLDREKLEKLSRFLEKEKANIDKCKAVLKHTVETLERQEKEARQKRAEEQEAANRAYELARKQEAEKKVETMREWTEEELKMLDKALTKFPQGTRKRWDQVTNYVRTRTLDEVLLMVKERKGASVKRFEAQQNWRASQKDRQIASEPTKAKESFTDVQINRTAESQDGTQANSTEADWTKDQELALVKALKAIGKDAADRWGKIADQVPGKSKSECFKRFKELRESFRASKPPESS